MCARADDPTQHDSMPDSMFRTLTADEEATFREWARRNYRGVINEMWHPVVRNECRRIGLGCNDECSEPGEHDEPHSWKLERDQ